MSTNPSSVPPKSFACEPVDRRELSVDDRVLERTFGEDRVHQRRDVAADPCRRTARRRRPWSPAPPWRRRRAPAPACRTPRRAARRTLRARSRRGTDRRRRSRRRAPRPTRGRRSGRASDAELRDEMIERRQVALEQAERADDQQPRARVEQRLVGVEDPDQILDLLVARSPGRRTGCWSTRRRTGRRRTGSAGRSRCEKSGTTGSTAVRGNPSASRSWRLNSESPSARSQRST